MLILFIILFISLWLTSGMMSFIFWWTKDHDFTSSQILSAMFMSIMGPLAYIVGWLMHGDKSEKVFISRRK